MPTLGEIKQRLKELRIPRAGVDFVIRVSQSPPSRRVQARGRLNSPVRIPVESMGHSEQGEGTTTEGANILELEYDRKGTFAYWNQVLEVEIEGTRRDGRAYRRPYKADSLAIKSDNVYVIENKTESELRALCKKHPNEWTYSEGRYHFIPAERAYESLGLVHIVVSSEETNPIRFENLNLLIQLRNRRLRPPGPRLTKKIIHIVKKHGAVSLFDLGRALGNVDVTPVLQLIEAGSLITNLSKTRLSVPEAGMVATDPILLEKVLALNDQLLPGAIDDIEVPLQRVPRAKYIIEHQDRIAQARGDMAPKRRPRTVRNYRKALRDAGGDTGALEVGYYRCGRKRAELSKAHRRLIRYCIKKYYGTPEARNDSAVHRRYLHHFKHSRSRHLGKKPLVYNTFRKFIEAADQYKLALKRGGLRAANAAAAPTDPKVRLLPPSRPFQRAHIDHYLSDGHVIIGITGRATYTARPWVTVMSDDYTNGILAFRVGFRLGRHALAGVMRDCVRRHRRLPEWVVVDQGAEFNSVYFEKLLAKTKITKQERPTSAPRFGGSLERKFGITRAELFGDLPGNTNNSRRGRAASASHKPPKTAKLMLADFYRAIERYFFCHFNAHSRGEANFSPDVLMKKGISTYAFSGVPVEYDQAFLIKTAIPAPSKSYPVDPQRGVRVLQKFYRSLQLSASNITRVAGVMLEPADDNIIYIPLKGRWNVARHQSAYDGISSNLVSRMCESAVRYETRETRGQFKRAADIALAGLMRELTPRSKRPATRTKHRMLKSAPVVPHSFAYRKAGRTNDIKPFAVV